ncbi:AMP-binding protein [Mesosutterella sp. OilRF-GAM-744-9]|uniref:AMP-binding protein n=1 Tax=Mesosutterella porci TaxID=2915351 RepID=A0ABS9MP77_9BURK|nr:AMP-dependent synthetase/ligase [Mesosutterella sp. oilRF-744-WT-GAM-9]MCG5030187.1 AMP-binding protein [Mesosutterella sp. oilRF-744-WT-GAM-9]MCI6531018.1 AMP-binding protein [Mesosutterella sp.]
MSNTTADRIALLKTARVLPDLINNRLKVAPDDEALRQYDRTAGKWNSYSYRQLADRILGWRRAYATLGLARYARVAILLPNGIDAVCADQGALSNALTPVPLHAIDTPGACAFILIDSQSSVLITNKLSRWQAIAAKQIPMPDLKHVVFTEETQLPAGSGSGVRLHTLEQWLKDGAGVPDSALAESPEPEDLGAIVYTSGTTGRPKGVMLTHKNFLTNVVDTTDCLTPVAGDVFLSFLPLSHTFERTLGYYLPLGMGCTVVYNRSIMLLAEDFKVVKPTVIISVPRIYERTYAKIQAVLGKKGPFAQKLFDWAVEVGWRKFCRKNRLPVEHSPREFLDPIVRRTLTRRVSQMLLDQFGGRLRVAISGGAAISQKVAKVFCGLGMSVIQGYGMTETSPVIAGNNLQDNQPRTVGHPYTSVQVRLGEGDEIQVKGPSVMRGYWNRPDATKDAFTADGWLKTGDVGTISEDGHLYIKGRIKEIIVTSTGEKVPPVDLESAIETDPLFSQTFVVGENKPYISLIAVLNPEEWEKLARSLKLDPRDPESLSAAPARQAALKRAKAAAANFPHYSLPRAVTLSLEPWTIDNGLLTPTLKLKRGPLSTKFAEAIKKMY